MPDRLPSLTALRAFDAAARHMSFAKAADELHVSPAALSFQIKALEEHLGQPVFRRLNRAVELTEAGEALAPGLRDGFAEITAAWSKVRRMGNQRVLTVTAGPAFTSLWLAPRLFSFAAEHPDIELRFSAGFNLVDFERGDVDIAIRFGQGTDGELFSHHLIDEWMTPMMTPALAEGIASPEDLAALTLVHDDQSTFLKPPADWAAWFNVVGMDPPEMHGPRFNHAEHAVGAALAGVGPIMGRISLTEAALRDGRLVMPFVETLTTQATYRVVCPAGTEERPPVAQFIQWIERELSELTEFNADRRFIALPDH